jgi:hypothetical protein
MIASSINNTENTVKAVFPSARSSEEKTSNVPVLRCSRDEDRLGIVPARIGTRRAAWPRPL